MLRLADSGEGTEQHRGDRDEHDDLLPLGQDAGEAVMTMRAVEAPWPPTFGAEAKKAVTGVGEPS
jgi:hypothetical protein